MSAYDDPDDPVASDGTNLSPESVGLPLRTFLYTLDQIAGILGTSVSEVRRDYIYFYGVDGGLQPKRRMVARNIADETERPDWRVAETEFVRWLRHKRFRVYHRGSVRS